MFSVCSCLYFYCFLVFLVTELLSGPGPRGKLRLVSPRSVGHTAAAPADDELDALLAGCTDNPLVGKSEWSEAEALQALATWKEQRLAVNEVKKARGISAPSPKVDLAAVRARVRCSTCKQL